MAVRMILVWMMLAIAWLAPGDELQAQVADYLRDVKPLLEQKCYACHGALKQQAGLRLDTGLSILKGGDSGPPVIPKNPDDSLLIQVLTGDAGFQMPPANQGSLLMIRNYTSCDNGSPMVPLSRKRKNHNPTRVPGGRIAPSPDLSKTS